MSLPYKVVRIHEGNTWEGLAELMTPGEPLRVVVAILHILGASSGSWGCWCEDGECLGADSVFMKLGLFFRALAGKTTISISLSISG